MALGGTLVVGALDPSHFRGWKQALSPPVGADALHTVASHSSLALVAARAHATQIQTRPHPIFMRFRFIKVMEDSVPAGAPAHPAHSGLELAAAQPRVARALDQPRRSRSAQERRGH